MFLLAQGAALVASVTFGASDSIARADLRSATASGAPAQTYVVQPGDTLWSLAERFGTTVDELIAGNGLRNPDLLFVGEVLVVPGPPAVAVAGAQLGGGATYVVQPGDTLWGISRRFGITPSAIVAANGLAAPDLLRIGQVLLLPVAPAPMPGYTLPVPPLGDPSGSVGTAPPTTRPATTTTRTPTTTTPTTPTTTPTTTAGAQTYRVVSGDTLYSIARRFGSTVQAIAAANGIGDANGLSLGQVLVIPTSGGSGTTTPTTRPVTTTTRPPTTTPTTASNPPGGPSTPATSATLPRSLFGTAATDPRRLALIPSFDRWADTYRLPRDLPKGLGFVESAWRNDALSSAGAIGIGQLMPDTARWVATIMMGDPSLDPHVADDNIRMSCRYLRYLLDYFGGDEAKAIAAYYQGPGAVSRGGISAEGQQYVNRVAAARAAFR